MDAPSSGHGQAELAKKVSISLREHETEIARNWFKAIIDDLNLASLESFPTGTIASAFPRLLSYINDSINEPEPPEVAPEVRNLAAVLATLNKEESAPGQLLDYYLTVKQLVVDAAQKNLRGSDLETLDVFQRIDRGVMYLFRTGLETFVERRAQKLQQLAHTDPLTGLFNLRYFRTKLHENLELYKRYGVPFSIVMVDLDKLKQLNDWLGHEVGDVALKHLSRIMKSEKRENDIAARYGGDEFFLLLPATGPAEAEALAKRIMKQTRNVNRETEGREMTSVSMGIVSCPEDGADISNLRAKADKALYRAKEQGGDAVSRFED